MSKEERQKKLLALLLGVLAVALAYRTYKGTGDDRARSARAGRDDTDSVLAQVEMPHLDLELLRREPAKYSPGRDLFRYAPKAPPKRVQQAAPRKPKQDRRPPPQPTVRAAAEPAAPPKPLPPDVDFTYLGSFGPPERRIAVFVKNDDIFNALTGDVLMERFIVDKIGFESADIKFVGFPDAPEQRLVAGG